MAPIKSHKRKQTVKSVKTKVFYGKKRKNSSSAKHGSKRRKLGASSIATISALQGTGMHADWSKLPSKTILKSSRPEVKTIGRYKLRHQMDYKIESLTTGTQAVGGATGIATQYQLAGTTSNDSTNYYFKWATDPFLLNPHSIPPVNSIYNATQPIVGVASDKICLKNCTSEMNVLSLDTIAQKVDIYWLMCNANTGNHPVDQWSTVETALGYLQTVSAVGTTTTADVTPTLGYGGRTIAEQPLPKGFGKYWKTLHRDTFVLQPGDSIRMTRILHFNRVITKAWLTNQSATAYLKGISVVRLVVVNGALVGVARNGETSFPVTHIDRVTQGRTKIGVLQKDDYVFGAMSSARYDINRLEIGNIMSATVITENIDNTDDVDQAEVLG